MTDSEKLDLILSRLAYIETRLALLENKPTHTVGIPNVYGPNREPYSPWSFPRALCGCPPNINCGNTACPYKNIVTNKLFK